MYVLRNLERFKIHVTYYYKRNTFCNNKNFILRCLIPFLLKFQITNSAAVITENQICIVCKSK